MDEYLKEHRQWLDELMKKLGHTISTGLDEKILIHLGTTLFNDPKFVKWFMTHYDFSYNIIKNEPASIVNNKAVFVREYSFNGPTWIPFWTRVKRELKSWLKTI
jgi:hypothetical protein